MNRLLVVAPLAIGLLAALHGQARAEKGFGLGFNLGCNMQFTGYKIGKGCCSKAEECGYVPPTMYSPLYQYPYFNPYMAGGWPGAHMAYAPNSPYGTMATAPGYGQPNQVAPPQLANGTQAPVGNSGQAGQQVTSNAGVSATPIPIPTPPKQVPTISEPPLIK